MTVVYVLLHMQNHFSRGEKYYRYFKIEDGGGILFDVKKDPRPGLVIVIFIFFILL